MSADAQTKVGKLFDAIKGLQLASYERKLLLKTLTVNLDDAKLAEFGLSILDKFATHHWNQAELVASNMPLFLGYND